MDDNTLILRAIVTRVAYWRPFHKDKTSGDLVVNGVAYYAEISHTGLPIINDNCRQALVKGLEQHN